VFARVLDAIAEHRVRLLPRGSFHRGLQGLVAFERASRPSRVLREELGDGERPSQHPLLRGELDQARHVVVVLLEPLSKGLLAEEPALLFELGADDPKGGRKGSTALRPSAGVAFVPADVGLVAQSRALALLR